MIVARTRENTPERELTIKRLRITRDRMMLVPESTNPVHKPFTFTMPHVGNETLEGFVAQIVAVCLQAVWILT